MKKVGGFINLKEVRQFTTKEAAKALKHKCLYDQWTNGGYPEDYWYCKCGIRKPKK